MGLEVDDECCGSKTSGQKEHSGDIFAQCEAHVHCIYAPYCPTGLEKDSGSLQPCGVGAPSKHKFPSISAEGE